MMFTVILRQNGGCDYTIGCGVKVSHLRATTLPEAEEEVGRLVDEYGTGESAVDAAMIYEVVARTPFDIEKHRQRTQEAARLKKEREDKKKREADFERLKKEFGGT